MAATIDREIRRLIDEAHGRARAVLTHHRSILERMAQQLVEKETLDPLELAGILGPLDPWPLSDEAATPGPGEGRRAGRSQASKPEVSEATAVSKPAVSKPEVPKAQVPGPSQPGRSTRSRCGVSPT